MRGHKPHWRNRRRDGELRRLSARSASNKSSSISFSEPCRKSGISACGAASLAGRHLPSHPSDDGVSVASRNRNRAHAPVRRHAPIRRLRSLTVLAISVGFLLMVSPSSFRRSLMAELHEDARPDGRAWRSKPVGPRVRELAGEASNIDANAPGRSPTPGAVPMMVMRPTMKRPTRAEPPCRRHHTQQVAVDHAP
jgi:hypothetical protein